MFRIAFFTIFLILLGTHGGRAWPEIQGQALIEEELNRVRQNTSNTRPARQIRQELSRMIGAPQEGSVFGSVGDIGASLLYGFGDGLVVIPMSALGTIIETFGGGRPLDQREVVTGAMRDTLIPSEKDRRKLTAAELNRKYPVFAIYREQLFNQAREKFLREKGILRPYEIFDPSSSNLGLYHTRMTSQDPSGNLRLLRDWDSLAASAQQEAITYISEQLVPGTMDHLWTQAGSDWTLLTKQTLYYKHAAYFIIKDIIKTQLRGLIPEGLALSESRLDEMARALAQDLKQNCLDRIEASDGPERVDACISRFSATIPYDIGREALMYGFAHITTQESPGQDPIYDTQLEAKFWQEKAPQLRTLGIPVSIDQTQNLDPAQLANYEAQLRTLSIGSGPLQIQATLLLEELNQAKAKGALELAQLQTQTQRGVEAYDRCISSQYLPGVRSTQRSSTSQLVSHVQACVMAGLIESTLATTASELSTQFAEYFGTDQNKIRSEVNPLMNQVLVCLSEKRGLPTRADSTLIRLTNRGQLDARKGQALYPTHDRYTFEFNYYGLDLLGPEEFRQMLAEQCLFEMKEQAARRLIHLNLSMKSDELHSLFFKEGMTEAQTEQAQRAKDAFIEEVRETYVDPCLQSLRTHRPRATYNPGLCRPIIMAGTIHLAARKTLMDLITKSTDPTTILEQLPSEMRERRAITLAQKREEMVREIILPFDACAGSGNRETASGVAGELLRDVTRADVSFNEARMVDCVREASLKAMEQSLALTLEADMSRDSEETLTFIRNLVNEARLNLHGAQTLSGLTDLLSREKAKVANQVARRSLAEAILSLTQTSGISEQLYPFIRQQRVRHLERIRGELNQSVLGDFDRCTGHGPGTQNPLFDEAQMVRCVREASISLIRHGLEINLQQDLILKETSTRSFIDELMSRAQARLAAAQSLTSLTGLIAEEKNRIAHQVAEQKLGHTLQELLKDEQFTGDRTRLKELLLNQFASCMKYDPRTFRSLAPYEVEPPHRQHECISSLQKQAVIEIIGANFDRLVVPQMGQGPGTRELQTELNEQWRGDLNRCLDERAQTYITLPQQWGRPRPPSRIHPLDDQLKAIQDCAEITKRFLQTEVPLRLANLALLEALPDNTQASPPTQNANESWSDFTKRLSEYHQRSIHPHVRDVLNLKLRRDFEVALQNIEALSRTNLNPVVKALQDRTELLRCFGIPQGPFDPTQAQNYLTQVMSIPPSVFACQNPRKTIIQLQQEIQTHISELTPTYESAVTRAYDGAINRLRRTAVSAVAMMEYFRAADEILQGRDLATTNNRAQEFLDRLLKGEEISTVLAQMYPTANNNNGARAAREIILTHTRGVDECAERSLTVDPQTTEEYEARLNQCLINQTIHYSQDLVAAALNEARPVLGAEKVQELSTYYDNCVKEKVLLPMLQGHPGKLSHITNFSGETLSSWAQYMQNFDRSPASLANGEALQRYRQNYSFDWAKGQMDQCLAFLKSDGDRPSSGRQMAQVRQPGRPESPEEIARRRFVQDFAQVSSPRERELLGRSFDALVLLNETHLSTPGEASNYEALVETLTTLGTRMKYAVQYDPEAYERTLQNFATQIRAQQARRPPPTKEEMAQFLAHSDFFSTIFKTSIATELRDILKSKFRKLGFNTQNSRIFAVIDQITSAQSMDAIFNLNEVDIFMAVDDVDSRLHILNHELLELARQGGSAPRIESCLNGHHGRIAAIGEHTPADIIRRNRVNQLSEERKSLESQRDQLTLAWELRQLLANFVNQSVMTPAGDPKTTEEEMEGAMTKIKHKVLDLLAMQTQSGGFMDQLLGAVADAMMDKTAQGDNKDQTAGGLFDPASWYLYTTGKRWSDVKNPEKQRAIEYFAREIFNARGKEPDYPENDSRFKRERQEQERRHDQTEAHLRGIIEAGLRR